MRQAFAPVLATLALGAVAVAPKALADDCRGGRCASRNVERDDSGGAAALETGDASVSADHDGAGAVGGAGDEYDVSGLVDSESLSGRRSARWYGTVATAYAAPLVATQDTCMGSRTFGVQAMGFGISFATTWQDNNCRRLKNARALDALGYRGAAIALLCMDDEVYDAMNRAGTPCPSLQFISSEPELPPPPEPDAEPPLISFNDVLFDFDKSTLRPEANAILEPLLAMMRADPEMVIDIEGHTDWVGSDAYNQGLSQRRAQAVVEWLVAHGIARERIAAIGRGEGEPVASNQTAEGRQLNRRVEIRRRQT